MTDFFISYTGADQQWAEWIGFVLEEKGFTTTLQAWDFRPGSNFVMEMQIASSSARRTIMVLSSDYLDSKFASPEWAAAFLDDPMGFNEKLVPVMVRPCNPIGLLGTIVQIRLTDLDEAEAVERLLAGVDQARAKPSSRPAFPGAALNYPPEFPGTTDQAEERTTSFRGGIPKLRVAPTDIEKRRFVKKCFETMKVLFERSAKEVSEQEPRVEIEFEMRTSAEFRAELYLDGKSKNMCRVQLGGSHSQNNIAFSEGGHLSDNGYNELITLQEGDELYFAAAMAMGFSRIEKEYDLKHMNADQAAHYLWERFTASLQWQ
ncbi:toll/interleukin-1 receptor domain-containing protein [Rhizobium ruizarguesonis]|uniref:toll/interleukin-1 receptor domain-containing protein n=1 Tax=Rhizobium ruizarguesonis TaxID=2081791 RepID=UPI00102F6DE9|nr:toll/interleukin-1 receptor domain-containing protein [Rhizobium ruizarguesonis]NKL10876.1 TIR domain-containing protein [Rhizobium leguminosarum bv. viciae]NEJ03104.1 TIR domain-containing protein [Rhizobium ruizarguesonis]NEJ40220.1 TIR domain-containing protein [Rhizobium ruizarguesonis]TAT91697.1 toll/interleukin-1 receptor domain-containing protein [Rhizobium ruizarguesonis]TAZ03638.1 toll/interleukin-1 receptor domain-containing protein [Rhizobium ruizarguesonis]